MAQKDDLDPQPHTEHTCHLEPFLCSLQPCHSTILIASPSLSSRWSRTRYKRRYRACLNLPSLLHPQRTPTGFLTPGSPLLATGTQNPENYTIHLAVPEGHSEQAQLGSFRFFHGSEQWFAAEDTYRPCLSASSNCTSSQQSTSWAALPCYQLFTVY